MTLKMGRYLGVVFLFALIAAAAGCGSRETAGASESAVARAKLEAVKPHEDDGAIYGATKEFVRALVADERDQVLSLLTAEHRNGWEEQSFLITDAAKAKFDEFKLENLRHTVVKYMNNEDTGFENTGVVFAVYDVVMKNGGQEQDRVKIQESLVFRRENGKWLISLDERGFLVKTD